VPSVATTVPTHTSSARCASGISATSRTPSLPASLCAEAFTLAGSGPSCQTLSSLIPCLRIHHHAEREVRHPLPMNRLRQLRPQPRLLLHERLKRTFRPRPA